MCSSVIGEEVLFMDSRGIGRMGVMNKIVIVDYSMSVECVGSRGSVRID
jgi:hypothetical protein